MREDQCYGVTEEIAYIRGNLRTLVGKESAEFKVELIHVEVRKGARSAVEGSGWNDVKS